MAEYQAAKTPINKTREALERHQGSSDIAEALPRLKRPQGGKKRARKSKRGQMVIGSVSIETDLKSLGQPTACKLCAPLLPT